MSSIVLAAYYAIGVALTQIMHTLHTGRTYYQKQVRALERFGWFEREDPDHPNEVRLFWLTDPEKDEITNYRIQDFGSTEERTEYCRRFPSQLPELQQELDEVPTYLRWPFKKLGLQATNLYYCYVVSVLYGIIAFAVIWQFVPRLTNVTLPSLVLFSAVFLVLHAFSFFFVGSSVALTLLEGNLAFNTLVLALRFGEQIPYRTAVGVLQFGAALTVGPLVFWLHFQYDQGHIEYGNFITMYYIILPILYAEFLVLLLGLL